MSDTEKKSKILLIDDDTSLLVTLRDFLQFEGYEVITAASGEEGIELLESTAPDLIVLDMSMPGMGGLGFLQHISQEGEPQYPVLVLTARSQLAEYFGDVDVEGFVSKPCDPNDLLMEISRIVFLTRGKAEGAGIDAAGAALTVLLGGGEEDVSPLAPAFRESGYLVHMVGTGPELLESAILERPAAVVMTQALALAEDGAMERMLSEMPNTGKTPAVIFSAGEDRAVTTKEGAPRRYLATADPRAVVSALGEVLG